MEPALKGFCLVEWCCRAGFNLSEIRGTAAEAALKAAEAWKPPALPFRRLAGLRVAASHAASFLKGLSGSIAAWLATSGSDKSRPNHELPWSCAAVPGSHPMPNMLLGSISSHT